MRRLSEGSNVTPNILAVHDVGQAGDNYFFVMDYLPGPSLKRRVEQKGRLVPILRQLAGALDYTHSKRLIQGYTAKVSGQP